MPPPESTSGNGQSARTGRPESESQLHDQIRTAGAESQFQNQSAREALFHSLATAHVQRAQILEELPAINRKLAALLELKMNGGGLP